MKVRVVTPMWPSSDAPHKGIFVKNICDGLSQHGFQIEEVATVVGQPSSRWKKARAHAELGAQIAKATNTPVEILYCHAPSWFSPLVQASAVSAKRLVIHAHGGEVYPFSRTEALARPVVGELCRRADLVISPSQAYARVMQTNFRLADEQSFVSPSGGVNTGLFQPKDRNESCLDLKLDPKRPVVGFVGRLDRVKGPLTFARAVKQLGPDVQALIVGQGEVEAELREALPDALMVDFVPQDKLPTYYSAMNALAFPTEREALGLVPIEAMACGVPVVAPNSFANSEFVRPSQSGVLVEPHSASDLARGLREILGASAAESRTHGENTRRIALEYDSKTVAAALADRLRRLLA